MTYTKDMMKRVSKQLLASQKLVQRHDKLFRNDDSLSQELKRALRKKPTVESVDCVDIIYHKVFGTGEVLKVDRDAGRILIHFPVGDKLFQYPEAFDKGYLFLEKPSEGYMKPKAFVSSVV